MIASLFMRTKVVRLMVDLKVLFTANCVLRGMLNPVHFAVTFFVYNVFTGILKILCFSVSVTNI